MFKRSLIIATGLFLGVQVSFSQNRQPAFDMNERLGRGINMGNSFEAPTETAWGNPWKPAYFKIISELGFNHVRVPIRWETPERSSESEPYLINPDFLNRIQQVVDTALKYQLHVVIDMHHHDALFENPTVQKERFLSQWSQIADLFKDYPDSLLFEVLNEPHGNLSPSMWNEFFADALAEIRNTNPTRVVLMGIADFGGLSGISKLELPNDDYIIMSPHYYNPFPFTHQGAEWVSGANDWLGTKWLDTEADRESVMTEFNYALHFSETHNIPIHVGEFGAYSTADIESRVRWTTFLARWFEEKNLSWAYWEFSAGFGIYDPTTQATLAPLVDALLHSEMPEPTPIYPTTIYNSSFSNGNDGWSLLQQGGASGSLSTSGGKLQVAISNGGTESWHLQLVKNGISLQKDKLYRISFTAEAAADRSITFYAGKASSSWNAYSGSNAVSMTSAQSAYSFSFEMTYPTDPVGRLVFDLGTNSTAVTISNVKVEELSLTLVLANEDLSGSKIVAYPNPVSSLLKIEIPVGVDNAQLLDMCGRAHRIFKISPGSNTLNVEQILPGLYILSLSGRERKYNIKVLKE